MDRSIARQLDPDTPFLTDPAAQAVCAAVQSGGHVALFVGGCVRNALLGAPASDIDIATDATPDQVIGLAGKAGLRTVPTGIDHGTVTVVVDGHGFEVTTFRKDVATDGRRAVVAFSRNITDDARRRDFTMNAIYARPDGTLVDPLNGLPDLVAGRVRFIEDAGQRIREDFLRTLRFFRFHAFYADPNAGWDSDALAGIAANLDGLETLSAERTGAEITKLLSAPDPVPALAVMAQTGVLGRILPGADPTFVAPFVHLEAEAALTPDPMARLAALGGMDVGDRLRLSRAQQKHLGRIRDQALSAYGPEAVGYLVGEQAGIAAMLLRSALSNTVPDPSLAGRVSKGATAEFPVKAADLAPLTGKALGDALARKKDEWLASGLAKTRIDLLGP